MRFTACAYAYTSACVHAYHQPSTHPPSPQHQNTWASINNTNKLGPPQQKQHSMGEAAPAADTDRFDKGVLNAEQIQMMEEERLMRKVYVDAGVHVYGGVRESVIRM